jgi:oxazoline/thiazoline synthase
MALAAPDSAVPDSAVPDSGGHEPSGPLRRPRLRADYAPVRLAGDKGPYLLLRGETRNLLIEDAATADLAVGLDGTRDADDVLAALSARYQARTAAAALRRLRALRVLADGPAATASETAAAWDTRLVDPAAAEDWTRQGEVVLLDAGSAQAGNVASQLASLGFGVRAAAVADLHGTALNGTGAAPPVIVAVTGSMTDPALAAINAACLRAGLPWTLVRPHGHVLLLGPHLVPGRTGCWECLRQRWTANEQLDSFLAGQNSAALSAETLSAETLSAETLSAETLSAETLSGETGPAGPQDRVWPALASLTAALAGLLAAELPVLALRGHSDRITGRMVALDTADLTLSHHPLVRQPHCPACGEPAPAGRGARVTLRAGRERRDESDGLAAERAAATVRRLEHHVSSYLGVISRLAPVAAGDGMFSYSARHPFTRPVSAADLRGQLRGLSGGKGPTDAEAKASAMAEAIERYCGTWQPDHAEHQASFAQHGPGAAVRPSDILLFSPRQYASRRHLNPGLAHFHRIPEPVADDTVISWTDGWSLTNDREVALPAAYCWYGHPSLASAPVCGADSNGCAAGDSLEDAVLRGFCELAERDSVALWWYHRSLMPAVDLHSAGDPWLARVHETFEGRLDRELWVLDITSDLGVPSFAAVSRHTRRPTEDIIVGFGADLDPAVAVRRAVSELCQFLPSVAAFDGGRTRYGLAEPAAVAWLSTARVAEQPWLLPSPGLPPVPVAAGAHDVPRDAAACVRRCVDLASAAGLEVIVVDQTRQDIELAVARVVVPGLRHFWRRLGPGRLWDVPPRLGRCPLAADEDSVNPYSVFF